jgi:hypothetical protein
MAKLQMAHTKAKLWDQVPSLDHFAVQNSGDFLCWNYKVFMFQTWDNSHLLRRVLWISAELSVVSSLKHKNTQPLYMFNRVRVLHLDRLKEVTWLHSFVQKWWYDNSSEQKSSWLRLLWKKRYIQLREY